MVSATTVVGLSGLPGKPGDWNGALAMIGTGQDWVMQSGTVVSSATNSLTIAYQHYNSYQTPAVGNYLYLTGKFKALDAAKEWYRDPTNGRLYLWDPAGDNPAHHLVEAKHRMYALELSGRAYINVSGIHIFAASIDTDAKTNHVNFDSLAVLYVSQRALDAIAWDRRDDEGSSGIVLDGNYNVLSNSTIAYSSGNGVWLAGANNIVRNTTIHDVDYAVGAEAAITINGAYQQVLSNTIYNTGRDGIVIAESTTAAKIESNTIHDIGLLATDLGAIYTHGTAGAGTEIAYNKIYNVKTGGFGGVGVYLDNGSSGFIVHDNAISNTNNAIKLNPPTYGNQIYSNNVTKGSQVKVPKTGPASLSSSSATLDLLGTLGGYGSAAYAINNLGTVAGASTAPGHGDLSFLYSNGQMGALPTLGGDYTQANAINDAGQVVGSSVDASGLRVAYVYSKGQISSLGALPGDSMSVAQDINNAGQIVGESINQGGVGRAFVYSDGALKSLGTLGGSISQASAINDNGDIVGASSIAGDRYTHAFLYSSGKMQDLGTLGGSSSYALGINGSQTIVGESLVKGDSAFHAFIDVNGQMTDLGVPSGFTNSVANAINDDGDIVGYCYNAGSSKTHAFLYRNGQMIDLNSMVPSGSGWLLNQAAAINIQGQIVGSAIDSDSNPRAFVLSIFN